MQRTKMAAMVSMMTAIAMSLAGCSGGNGGFAAPANSAKEASNPALVTSGLEEDGADPWIVYEDGLYYYSKIVDDQVVLLRSPHLTSIAAGERSVAFDGGEGIESYWAPELHRLDGSWYIYFAAQPVGGDGIHRTYVLSNPSKNPFEGEWTLHKMDGMDDKFAIDGTVVENNRGRWFVWSGWAGNENVRQDIYIAPMASPTEVRGQKVLISKPDHGWERHGDPKVNEGPAAIVRGDTVNLAYSASGSWTNEYCIGLLTASVDADLANPDSWVKHDKPIMSSGNGIIAPGHNSFVASEDGAETYMVYHSARFKDGGWNRSVRFQPVAFDDKGVLEPMEPLRSSKLQPQPSGEHGRLRILAEDARLSGDAELSKDVDALDGKAVAGLEDDDDAVEWKVRIPSSGQWGLLAWMRMDEVGDEDERAGVMVSVDSSDIEDVPDLVPATDYQPIAVRFALDAGEHTIRISANSIGNPVHLDRVELIPL